MSDRTEQLLDELVRLNVRALRQEAQTQAAAIGALDELGFGNDRIAELLGTSSATVRNAVTRKKAAEEKATKGASGKPKSGKKPAKRNARPTSEEEADG